MRMLSRLTYIPALVCVCTMLSCAERPTAIQTSPVAVVSASLPDTVTLGEPIRFEAVCSTANPCWELERVAVNTIGFTYEITIYARYDGRPCIQTVGTLNVKSTLLPKQPGIYTLRFGSSAHKGLEKTVVVR